MRIESWDSLCRFPCPCKRWATTPLPETIDGPITADLALLRGCFICGGKEEIPYEYPEVVERIDGHPSQMEEMRRQYPNAYCRIHSEWAEPLNPSAIRFPTSVKNVRFLSI
jgi:hypothetical protein